jgi:hypothetical protein
VLAGRLRKLVAAGILTTAPHQEPNRRTWHEYQLTDKGFMVALRQWGDKHAADPEGPVLEVQHSTCGAPVRAVVECSGAHAALTPAEVTVLPGPAARRRP